MGCFGGSSKDRPVTRTKFASDLDALPGATAKRRKRKKGDLMAGEAQLDLGASGQLGSGSPRASLFG